MFTDEDILESLADATHGFTPANEYHDASAFTHFTPWSERVRVDPEFAAADVARRTPEKKAQWRKSYKDRNPDLVKKQKAEWQVRYRAKKDASAAEPARGAP